MTEEPEAICVYPTLFEIRVYHRWPGKSALTLAYVVSRRGTRVTPETVHAKEQEKHPGVDVYISTDWKEIYHGTA